MRIPGNNIVVIKIWTENGIHSQKLHWELHWYKIEKDSKTSEINNLGNVLLIVTKVCKWPLYVVF